MDEYFSFILGYFFRVFFIMKFLDTVEYVMSTHAWPMSTENHAGWEETVDFNLQIKSKGLLHYRRWWFLENTVERDSTVHSIRKCRNEFRIYGYNGIHKCLASCILFDSFKIWLWLHILCYSSSLSVALSDSFMIWLSLYLFLEP